jgi:hypothetical protein
MPIATQAYYFTRQNILVYAPDTHGVYGLYDGTGVPIYYGRAMGNGVTVKSRLLSHERGDEGPCTKSAYSFNTEVCFNPAQREQQLLAEHQRVYGRLPRCNEVMP